MDKDRSLKTSAAESADVTIEQNGEETTRQPAPSNIAETSEEAPRNNLADKPESEETKEAAVAIDPAEKITTLEAESQKNYDRFLRVSAEFDNYKKRATREMTEFKKYATEALVKELLPVIDNLERALISSGDNAKVQQGIIEGVTMTLQEILKIMEKHGVTQIDPLHQPFDPMYHQAVMREETDEFPENTVSMVLQKGYRLHDRLIRPAMVAVSAPMGKPTEQSIENKD